MKYYFFFLISFSFTLSVFADSPITSTNFYQAYLEDSIVGKAERIVVIDKEIADYLLSEEIGIYIKVAVCNALAKAQTFIDVFEWCKMWEICREVKDNPDLKPDILPEADEIIFDYIGIYESE